MAEYANKKEILKNIESLKLSPWFNRGKNDTAYQHSMFLERKEGVEIVTDLCVKQIPTADVIEREKINEAIEEIANINDWSMKYIPDENRDIRPQIVNKVKQHCIEIIKKHIG